MEHLAVLQAALTLLLWNRAQVCFGEMVEYCQWETFNPKCAADEIIMMQGALYGRMRSGKCIERDYGYVGCSSDVLTLADSLCSGRRECNLKIPVEKFQGNSSCPKDLSRYLMADYSCVKVITPNRTFCYSHKTALLPATGGWIASKTTEDSSCGSTETPWVIRTDPGQTMNFTLYDFALKSAIYNDSTSLSTAAAHCHVYIIFKEKTSGRSKTVCGGKTRVSEVYTTLANEVEIRLMGGTTTRYFALQYEIQGCPDPMQPIGGWVERRGDQVTMGCDGDDNTWTLNCIGNQWVGAKVRNCSKASVTTGELAFAGIPFSHTLSIVVILAVAMVIGVLILAVGLLCLKRRQRSGIPPHPSFGSFSAPGYKEDMNYKTASTTCTGYSQPSFMTRTDTSGENDYEYVDDIKLPPPPPISAGSTFGKAVSPPGSVCAAHGTNTLNQYGFDGTPNFAKMRALQQPGPVHLVHQMPPTGTPIFPQYYELDPDSPKEAGPKPPQTQSSAFVSRAFSEENSENVAKPTRQNMNFGHYSQ